MKVRNLVRGKLFLHVRHVRVLMTGLNLMKWPVSVITTNTKQNFFSHLLFLLFTLHVSSSTPSDLFLGFLGWTHRWYIFLGQGRGSSPHVSYVSAPPAPTPSGPPSTHTPGGSSTLSKKRPPPPPPGHKRTLSDPPSPLSHSKGGLTGGEHTERSAFWYLKIQPRTQLFIFTPNHSSNRPQQQTVYRKWTHKCTNPWN